MIDIPSFKDLPPERRDEELERALRDLAARLDRIREEMNRKVEELRVKYGIEH